MKNTKQQRSNRNLYTTNTFIVKSHSRHTVRTVPAVSVSVTTHTGPQEDGDRSDTPRALNTRGATQTDNSKESQGHTPTVIQAACCSSPTLPAAAERQLMPAAGPSDRARGQARRSSRGGTSGRSFHSKHAECDGGGGAERGPIS